MSDPGYTDEEEATSLTPFVPGRRIDAETGEIVPDCDVTTPVSCTVHKGHTGPHVSADIQLWQTLE
jgi:hypothetical protein